MILVGIMVIVVAIAIAIIVHTNYIKIERYPIKNKGIKCRIAHISDIHGKINYLNGTLHQILNKESIDFLIITGDLSKNLKQRQKVLDELKRIKVSKASYIILGNYEREECVGFKKRKLEITNEYYHNLNTTQQQILINEYRIYTDPSSGKKILFYGFDNSKYGNETYPEDLEHSGFDLRILFAHSPNIERYIKERGIVYDLLLVGHTHGNQINLPLLNQINRGYSEFHVGYKLEDGKVFNISHGLGTSKIPIRIHSSPQITIFDSE